LEIDPDDDGTNPNGFSSIGAAIQYLLGPTTTTKGLPVQLLLTAGKVHKLSGALIDGRRTHHAHVYGGMPDTNVYLRLSACKMHRMSSALTAADEHGVRICTDMYARRVCPICTSASAVPQLYVRGRLTTSQLDIAAQGGGGGGGDLSSPELVIDDSTAATDAPMLEVHTCT